MNQFSIDAELFSNDLLIIESEDDDFGSVLEISGIDENGTFLEVSNLDDLISFQIQTNESSLLLNYSCLYYDEDDSVWRPDGLSKDEIESGFHSNVTCHTSHFTMFRVEVNYGAEGNDEVDEVDDSQETDESGSSAKFQWWMGLLIAIAVIVFFFVLVAIIVFTIRMVITFRNRERSKSGSKKAENGIELRNISDPMSV